MKDQKLSGGSPPVSAQLRLSVVQNQPPRTSLLPSSRRVAQSLAPPSIQELISNPSYVSVPTLWSVDYVVPTGGGSYLSRGKLLREMYRRRVHYRSFNKEEAKKMFNFNNFLQGIEVLGPPMDYWLTFPLQQPPDNTNTQECKLFSGLPEDFVEDELACGWVIGPVKCTRKMLNAHVGAGQLPADDRLTFPWVTNANSTNFRSLDNITMFMDIRKIDGFVECIKCGEIMGIGYLLPGRFHVAVKQIFEKMDDFINDTERILNAREFGCVCEGILNPRLPIISENHRKINWLFLFYGMTLGLCTEEQLRYFCNQRKIPSLGNKNDLLRSVCLDICMQVDPESNFRDAGANFPHF